MITIERTSVMNFENAIRGARNPMNSWNRMDSFYDEQGNFIMGPSDLNLAQRLARAGSDHRKFIRQIFVYCPAVLVEGIRYIQGGNRGQLHLHHAQDCQQALYAG